jgi:hypothetical protein
VSIVALPCYAQSSVLTLSYSFGFAEFLCRRLEKYALDQRASSRPGWVPFMMKQAGVEWERIFDIFYVLFEEKMAPWHNEAALTFLVSDIGSLLSEWSASSLPLFLSSHPSISSIIEVLNPISLLLLQVL